MTNRLLIISILFIISFPGTSQNQVLETSITYKTKDIELYDALNELSQMVGYEFSYNADLIPANKIIKANFKNEKLQVILNNLLNDSTLNFRIVEKQIVIYKKNTLNALASRYPNLKDSIYQFTIKGKVIDQITGEPLAYANISILGKSIGTVSNDDGAFVFKIPARFLQSNLAISFVGYKNAIVPISELSRDVNIIYLKRATISLQEVVIRYVEPKTLIREAVEKIPKNYSTQDNIYTVFYREIIQRNDDYAAVSEAVLNVFKSPYNNYHNDHIRLLKSRKNIDYSIMDTIFFKLKGGLHASLYLDIIKNLISFIDINKLNLYEYTMTNIVKYDNGTAYEIEFSPRYYLKEESFRGKIFIDTETSAIKAAEFEIEPSAVSKMSQELVLKRIWGIKVKPVSAKYKVSYRLLNNVLHLNMVRGELDFKVKNRKQLFADNYKTIFEFAVNDIDTTNIDHFKRKEMINTEQVFIDQDNEYDADFWGEYNFIKPNEPLEEALVRIAKNLDNLKN
ncbi:MAG TPA: carboxypeptidase-like regulatory domain-containing protein [Bacteroidales bacterium]|nr:carboxypeptidase-like regulatory domain-containing protein [Bacteroidales bacterium]